MSEYTISKEANKEIFKLACSVVENNFEITDKNRPIIDVDGSVIQIYQTTKGRIDVVNDYYLDDVHIVTDVALNDVLNSVKEKSSNMENRLPDADNSLLVKAMEYMIAILIDRTETAIKKEKQYQGNSFYSGRRSAFCEVLDIIKTELIARDQDLSKYGLDVDMDIEDNNDNQLENLGKLDNNMNAYYERQSKALLKEKYEEYPHIIFNSLKLVFSVPSNSKNIKLIHIILDNIPNQLVKINDKEISIIFDTEEDIIQHLGFVSDILSIIQSWKKVSLQINGIDITPDMEFDYFVYAFLAQKNKDDFCFISDVDSVRRKYSARRNTERKTREEIPIKISRDNLGGSLLEVINAYIKLYCDKYHIDFFEISEYDRVIVVEDVLIVNFRLLPHYWRQTENHGDDWSCPYLLIQELTPNDLFKFNTAHFRRCMDGQHFCMDYLYFKGFDAYRKEIDNLDVVIKALPELKINERIEQYPGEIYHFVILRMEDIAGNIEYGVGYTNGKVHNYILNICKELEQKNSRALELNGISCTPWLNHLGFVNAFLSWKGMKKLWRLENKFSYFYEDIAVKNQWELDGIAKNVLAKAYEGAYANFEFGTYQKPVNRWKSEESVYNITKQLYKDYNVIYQHRPFYLSTDGGNMSYDVYICGLKVAIEYQGKQHFEPVDYFGGAEHFEQQQMRDKLKLERSIENGIKLVYVNYWEDITPELIKTKIDEALLSKQ